MRTVLSCVWALTVAGRAAGQAVFTGPSGGGMMAVEEAQVLEPGHFSLGLIADNYDRDPLGIDAFDVRVDWRLAVVHRVEIFGRYQISRAVSEPGAHPVPSPPLDVVSSRGRRFGGRPYRAIYWPMPYLSHHGARVDDMIPGEYVFGVKTQIAYPRGWRPALTGSAEISIPGDMTGSILQRGSGSGSIDLRFSGAATWRHGRLSPSINAGYTSNRKLVRGDRLIVRDAPEATLVTDMPIRRPGFLHLGVGLRVGLGRRVAAFTEASGWAPVGGATPTSDAAGASDVLGGLQIAVKGVCLTVGLRQQLAQRPNGVALPAGSLAGGLDLSALPEAAQRLYLQSLGVDARYHRPGAALVVVGAPPGAPDPEGSRRIPDTYLSHTSGHGGFVAAISFSF